MTERPLVAVGSPVRNRAWILPRYLQALEQLQYPVDRLRFGFVVNDCSDETEAMLRRWDRTPHIEQMNMGYPVWRRSQGYSIANLAVLRNRLVQWALSTGASYLFSVDSDILVPPNSLNQLIAAAKPVVSMLVCNTLAESPVLPSTKRPTRQPIRHNTPRPRQAAYNIMRRDGDGNLVHLFESYPRQRLFEVDLTGAAYLIDCAVLEAGVRYDDHPSGEDAAFCEGAQRGGFSLWCDSRIRGEHYMKEPRRA